MAVSYLFASGKGGVGKSTLAANLGVLLAEKGKRVALVDTDLGMRSLDLLLGMENNLVYDLIDVAEGKCLLSQALAEVPDRGGLHLLPASQFVRARDLDPRKLTKMVSLMKKDYDFILIDCPAGLERGLRNVLRAGKALRTLLIVTPDDLSIRDGERVIQLAEEKGLPRPQVIVNRLQNDLIYAGDMYSAQTVAQTLDAELMGELPEDPVFYLAQVRHQLAADYDQEARHALDRIARRMMGEDVPFPAYGKKRTSFFRRHFQRSIREVKSGT